MKTGIREAKSITSMSKNSPNKFTPREGDRIIGFHYLAATI